MPRMRTVARASKPARRRRRLAVGGLLLGTASVVGGGLSSPADAEEPTVVVTCTPQEPADPLLFVQLIDLPAADSQSFAYLFTRDGEQRLLLNVLFSGSFSLGGVASLPAKVGLAVYRDVNENDAWDPGIDETIYRGDGKVTHCPSTVTLKPK